MDADVRAFCYALTYDSIVLALALVCWIYLVRKLRRDLFRPNHRKVLGNQTSSGSSEVIDSSCCSIFPPWTAQLWRWEIEKFTSTDVYLYLLFLKSSAILFFLDSCVSMGAVFPIIWTARSESEGPGGIMRQRSFFERAVVTNVISTEFHRLWAIYVMVWLIAGCATYIAWKLYACVRSDEFRAALMTTKRATSTARKRNQSPRFLPSKYTVAIVGLDPQLLDAAVLRHALLCYFEDHEILAVRIVMDHSEALTAHRAFQLYLSNLLDAHRQQSSSDPPPTDSNWAIRLPVASHSSPVANSWSDNSFTSPKRQSRRLSAELGAPLLEGWQQGHFFHLARWSPPLLANRELSYSSDDSSASSSPTEKAVSSQPPQFGLTQSFQSVENLTSSPAVPRGTLGTVSEEETCDGGTQAATSSDKCRGGGTSADSNCVPVTSDWQDSSFLRKCGARRKDSKEVISHWEAKVLSQYSVLSRVKSRAPVRNVGIAFVSFRHPEAVRFALGNDFGDPSCPLFRARVDGLALSGGECIRSKPSTALWNPRWKVREAPPPEDIVWENIHVSTLGRGFRRIVANLTILVFSLVLTSSALAADALNPFAQHIENFLGKVSFLRMSVSGWIAPLFLYVINALFLPLLVSWAANASRFWRYSARDRSVLHGNINFMVINSLVFPVIGTTSIQGIFLFLYQNKITNLFTVLGQMVAGASGSFMTRYVLNTAFINSAFQLLQLPMLSQQRVLLKLGKKPTRWNFDFGYWYAFHLSLFAVSLIFSVDIPLVPLMGCLFFTAKFWVDKYNFAFGVWKVTQESAGAVASTVVLFIFGFVALFMLIMASYFVAVGLHAASVTESMATKMVNEAVLPFPLPDRAEPRAIVIGGFILLCTSVIMLLATFGERAQRTILDHHAGKLRRIARAVWTVVARRLARWGVVVPQREVVEAGSETPELTPTEIDELRIAYTHPYEREDKLSE